MKIQEVLEDLTEGGILFSGPKTSYMEANTQKDEETCISARDDTHRRPEHDFMCLEKLVDEEDVSIDMVTKEIIVGQVK